jgi:hypothetical protein
MSDRKIDDEVALIIKIVDNLERVSRATAKRVLAFVVDYMNDKGKECESVPVWVASRKSKMF